MSLEHRLVLRNRFLAPIGKFREGISQIQLSVGIVWLNPQRRLIFGNRVRQPAWCLCQSGGQ